MKGVYTDITCYELERHVHGNLQSTDADFCIINYQNRCEQSFRIQDGANMHCRRHVDRQCRADSPSIAQRHVHCRDSCGTAVEEVRYSCRPGASGHCREQTRAWAWRLGTGGTDTVLCAGCYETESELDAPSNFE